MNSKLVLILLFFTSFIHAQKADDMNKFVDKEQTRIDQIDGVTDEQIRLTKADDDQLKLFKSVYFKLADTIQYRINNSSKLHPSQRRNLLYGLYMTLNEVNGNTYTSPLYYQRLLLHAQGLVGAEENHDLESYLLTDPLYSVKNIYFYKYSPIAKDYLISSCHTNPAEVLKMFYKFKDRPYKDTVVEVCAIVAPNVAKNYLIGETGIRDILMKSPSVNIMGMRQFFANYNIMSKGMVIVDDIVEGNITLEEAHTISLDKRLFLRKLIEVRNSNYAMADYSLDEQLHTTSLEYVRLINELHNEVDPKVRFKSIDDFNWKELYTLLVYSEEEIFTSTFNGIFERLIYRLNQDKISGDKMLEMIKYNRFRTFIKICANYGKLGEYLKTMPKDQSRKILSKFTNNLDQNEGDLRSAINVANAFSSIGDSSLMEYMRANINSEFIRVEMEKNRNGIAIYGLLKSLFVKSNKKDSSWYATMQSNYKLNAIDKITSNELFGVDGVHRQIHFFYDDEDGEASFSSFMTTFTNPNYKITKKPRYVIIESTSGKKVKIYANLPKTELEGQADLDTIVKSFHSDIQMMVHRGHSYYAMNTIDQIPLNTKIVFLGSCGSYHNLHEVLNRSQNVHIISSKQIGAMSVNNPLLLNIAESVREGKGLVWREVWKKTDAMINKNPAAMERFRDYVSPDKNLGAIFLQAFTRVVTNN